MFLNAAGDDFSSGEISWDLSGAVHYAISYDGLVVQDAGSFGSCYVDGDFVGHGARFVLFEKELKVQV